MAKDPAQVLVVDDDPHIRDVIRIALEDAGMDVTPVANGQQAVTEVDRLSPDIVIMDVGMPEMNGFDACRAIRTRSAVPLLFLTARDDEIDRVLGFELGADDYVTKPFSPRELVLRTRAILARADGQMTQDGPLSHGDLSLDRGQHVCRLGASTVDLTGTEFQILATLVERPGRVFSRDQLIRRVYGENTLLSGRTVDSHIRNIRQKASADGYGDVIATVHGVGVKLGSCLR